MILFLKNPTFTTFPVMSLLALLKYQFMIINGMQSMYTTSNINITNARNPNMINENDIFTLGVIHSLKSIIKAIKDTGDSADEIDFEHVLETQRRNLSDPDLEEHIVDVNELEELK